MKLEGIFPALITPFTDNGSLNEDSLQRLIEAQLADGANGLFICGTSSEAMAMTTEERKRICQIAVKQINGKAVSMVHIGTTSTVESVALAKHAEASGADMIAAVIPFYYKYSFDEIKAYYAAISNAVKIPVLAYNIPICTEFELTPALFKQLYDEKYVVGLKHTSTNLYHLERFKRDCKDSVVLSGYDEICLPALLMGADGAIGTGYNYLSKEFSLLFRLAKQGEYVKAKAIQLAANDLIAVLGEVGALTGAKYFTEKRYGIPCGECRAPRASLSPEQKVKLDVAYSEFINSI